jgi:hypothetical protein
MPMTTSTAAPVLGPIARLPRLVVLLGVAAAVVAGLLRLADHVPPWLRGEPRGLVRYGSLEELERQLHVRLILPAFFPDILDWPPASVVVAPGEGQPIAVTFNDRATGRPRLVVGQNAAGDLPLPERLLPPGAVTQEVRVMVNDHRAVLRRVRGPDGHEWSDLSWVQDHRRFVLRIYGDDGPLLRIARSLHRVRS